MSDLTTGRTEPCKDNLGGLRRIYIMDYVEYSLPLMVGYKSYELTSFPLTYIFEFEGREKNANENYTDGYYNQEVSMTLAKQDIATHQVVEILRNKRVRVITEDHKRVLRIYGLKNGMDVEVSVKTGTQKQEFSGYSLNIIGREEYKSHFIGNLNDVGFFDEEPTFGELLASSSRISSLHYKISATNIPQ